MIEPRKIKFTPTKPDGSKYGPILAYTIPGMSGMCVHRLIHWHDPENVYDWGVSHIESGAILSYSLAFTRERAIERAKYKYGHIDFTKSFDEINKDISNPTT